MIGYAKTIKSFTIVLLICLLCLTGALQSGCTSPKEPDIIVGSKDYTEQYIMGYMLSLLIEGNTNLTVTFLSDLASDFIFAAARTGAVDVYVDYTGTIYSRHLGLDATNDSIEVFDASSRLIRDNYGLLMLAPLGFNNSFNLAVRSDTAREHGLRTFSDLARVSQGFTLAGSNEFLNRNDGIPSLTAMYDMSFRKLMVIHGTERYTAISSDRIQVTEVFSTDGQLFEYDLVVLEDDKQFFHQHF